MVKGPIDSADKVLLLTSLNFPVACTVLRKLRRLQLYQVPEEGWKTQLIGASVGEPHTSELNCGYLSHIILYVLNYKLTRQPEKPTVDHSPQQLDSHLEKRCKWGYPIVGWQTCTFSTVYEQKKIFHAAGKSSSVSAWVLYTTAFPRTVLVRGQAVAYKTLNLAILT